MLTLISRKSLEKSSVALSVSLDDGSYIMRTNRIHSHIQFERTYGRYVYAAGSMSSSSMTFHDRIVLARIHWHTNTRASLRRYVYFHNF